MSKVKDLDWLVGAWRVSGEAEGTVTYEWLDGGHFLVQRVDLVQGGERTRGIEIIGHERGFGAREPGPEVMSRYYDNHGNAFDYVYDFDGRVLTIWAGHRGSSSCYRGVLSADGRTLSGTWVWPGGGYKSTATRT